MSRRKEASRERWHGLVNQATAAERAAKAIRGTLDAVKLGLGLPVDASSRTTIKRARSVTRQRDELRRRVHKLERFARDCAYWRERCHEHDDDAGYPPRDFLDSEEWERLEEWALELIGGAS